MSEFRNVYNDLNSAIVSNILISGSIGIAADSQRADIMQSMLTYLTQSWQTNHTLRDEETTKHGEKTPWTHSQITDAIKDYYDALASGSPPSLEDITWLMTRIGAGRDDDYRANDLNQAQTLYSTANSQMQMQQNPIDTMQKSMAQQLQQDTSLIQPFTDMSSSAIGNGAEQAIAGFLQQQF